jgi:hypothetical protein
VPIRVIRGNPLLRSSINMFTGLSLCNTILSENASVIFKDVLTVMAGPHVNAVNPLFCIANRFMQNNRLCTQFNTSAMGCILLHPERKGWIKGVFGATDFLEDGVWKR